MKVWGLLLLLLLPGQAGAQQYYGAPLTGISISPASRQSDLELLPLKPGDIVTAEGIRAAIQALYDTGRYRYIEVDATRTERGANLTFNVREHYFFSTFRLEPDNLLERPISGFFRLPLGEKFSEAQVN